MTKQLLLITNIIKVYWNKVGLDIWLKLDNAIATKTDQMSEIISTDDGPKKKIKAQVALSTLVDTLQNCICSARKMVA